uniref:Uncharacterized protein n=1 Tax=viral metagenome TaxID=1070528 RepID=A0A6M3M4T1_9ZZZZ
MSIDDGWSKGGSERKGVEDYHTVEAMFAFPAIDRRDAEIARLEWRLQACEETRAELEVSFKATVAEVERLKTLLPPFTPCPVCGVVSWYPPKEMDPAVDRSKCLACGEPKEVDP